jgi:23S rRNA pseudouridine1911/1915/1917 synthase
VTRYLVRERFDRATLVECQLETGRTHQIRVHMAHIGHPLVGDATYGLKRSGNAMLDGFSRQALHAFRLGLRHPSSGDERSWEASVPSDMLELFLALKNSEVT